MDSRPVQAAMNLVCSGKIMAGCGLQQFEQSCICHEHFSGIFAGGLAGVDGKTHALDLLADRAASGCGPVIQKFKNVFDGAKVAGATQADSDGHGQSKFLHGIPPKCHRATPYGAALNPKDMERFSTPDRRKGCVQHPQVRHG